MKRIVLYIFCLLTLVACGGKGPQRPSRWLGRSPEPDSAMMNLMELNRQMATAADQELLRYVQSQDRPYALYNGGVWVCTLDNGDLDLQPHRFGQYCVLHIRVYTFDNKRQLLSDECGTYKVGESPLPLALVDVVRDKCPGAHVEMLMPWYSAFGVRGNENIPPYQNLLIDLTIVE